MCILWLYPQISSRYFPGKQSGDQVCPIVMQDPPITRTIHYWHNEDIQEQYHPTMVDVAFHVFNMYQLYVEYASIFILFHMSYFHIFPFISQRCDNFSKMWPPLFHIHMYTVYKYIYNYFYKYIQRPFSSFSAFSNTWIHILIYSFISQEGCGQCVQQMSNHILPTFQISQHLFNSNTWTAASFHFHSNQDTQTDGWELRMFPLENDHLLGIQSPFSNTPISYQIGYVFPLICIN